MSVRILSIDKCIDLQKLEKKKNIIVHYFPLMKESVVTNSFDA